MSLFSPLWLWVRPAMTTWCYLNTPSAKISVNPARIICLKAVHSDQQVIGSLFLVDANTDDKRMEMKDLGHAKSLYFLSQKLKIIPPPQYKSNLK